MELKRIDLSKFDYYYTLLEEDFCFEERRSKADEFSAFSNKKFYPCFICCDGQIVGYLCFWEFEDFIFGEHFAILKEIRNRTIGTTFLREFLQKQNKPFVFEIEIPFDTQSKRRIKFYERLNVVFNKYDYNQPSYHSDGKELQMIFVSYPKALSKKEFKDIVNEVRLNIYNVKPI